LQEALAQAVAELRRESLQKQQAFENDLHRQRAIVELHKSDAEHAKLEVLSQLCLR
jgi:hypothetical protein